MIRSASPFAPLLPALLLAGCVAVTINVTFPQDEIDTAASSIEDLVRQPPPAAEPPAPGPSSRGPASVLLTVLTPSVAEAQQAPDIRVRTPEVLALVESRRARYPALAAAMAAGCVGESARGLVEARPGAACPPEAAALVAAENRDRMALFQTIVTQNSMPPTDLPRVQAGFARNNRARAPAGTWIQDERGAWTRKP